MNNSPEELLVASSMELGGKTVDGASRVVSAELRQLHPIRREVVRRLLSTNVGLRIASLVTLLITSGCGNIELPKVDLFKTNRPGVSKDIPATPTSQSLTEKVIWSTPTAEVPRSPTPVATSTPEVPVILEQKIGAITLLSTEKNQLIGYRKADGKEVKFDQEKLEKVKQKAKALGEVEVLEIIDNSSKEPVSKQQNLAEHPVLSELPSDVLTAEELKTKGIEVIQAKNTDLYIRKGAFELGEPLADYAQGKHKMLIVLIDGPSVSPKFLDDSKYDQVRPILSQYLKNEKMGIDEYRREHVDLFNNQISEYRKKRDALKNVDPKKSEAYEDFIDSAKIDLTIYTNATDEDLTYEASLRGAGNYGGLYISPRQTTDNRAVVFLAVGGKYEISNKIAIMSNKKGELYPRVVTLKDTSGKMQPGSEQSFPDPKSFVRNTSASPSNPNSYPYGAQSIGLSLRHEFKHDELGEGFFRHDRGNRFIKSKEIDHEGFARAERESRSEYATDEAAMGDIQRAWQTWVNSGYKNDKLYHFVFRLPQGGYILTQNKGDHKQV